MASSEFRTGIFGKFKRLFITGMENDLLNKKLPNNKYKSIQPLITAIGRSLIALLLIPAS